MGLKAHLVAAPFSRLSCAMQMTSYAQVLTLEVQLSIRIFLSPKTS